MFRIKFIILLIGISFILVACPSFIVKMVDKMDKEFEGVYRPIYSTSSTNLDRIANDSSLFERFKQPEPDSIIAQKIRSFDIDSVFSENEVFVRHRDTVQIPGFTLITSMSISSPFSERQNDSIISDQPYGIHFFIRKIDDSMYPDSVKIYSVIRDGKGRFVTGLAPPYLPDSVKLDRYWQGLVDSSAKGSFVIKDLNVREVRKSESKPYSIVYSLDHSASMGDKSLLQLQKAMRQMLINTRKDDYVAVHRFTSYTTQDIYLNNNKDSSAKIFEINGLTDKYGNGTAIYDAVINAVYELENSPDSHSKALVLFTDGMDGLSKNSLDSAIMIAKEKNVEIFPIAYGMGITSTEPLKKLAKNTGGRFYRIYLEQEFPFVFAEIYLGLSSYYEITYTPPKGESKHKVQPFVNIPELGVVAMSDIGFYDQSILREFEPRGSIKILNIEFATGSANITESSKPIINDVVNALLSNPEMKIKIIGHTDNVGKEEANLKLSIQRAASVKEEIVKYGISPERIVTEGKGQSQPIVPNDSDENRKINRRTEFVIIK